MGLKACLRRLKAWITSETADTKQEELVNEDSDCEFDMGNQDILEMEMKRAKRGKRLGEENMKIKKEDTREEIKDKFNYLKEELKGLKESNTRLEYEVDYLRDEREEREEELKLQRVELLKLVEVSQVLKQEREGDKITIKMQQEMIDRM